MSGEVWDERKVMELDNEHLLEDCMEMAGMLDEVECLLLAYKKSGDGRLLEIALKLIGAEEGKDE